MRLFAMTVICAIATTMAHAQNATLSQTIKEPPVTTTATTPKVIVTTLDGPSPDPVGLLPSDVTGLPRDLWAASDSDTLAQLITALPAQSLPAIDQLLMTLLLAEADAPLGAGPDGALFIARIDKLLDLGALDPALALLDQVDPTAPAVFPRWFDVSLLTGGASDACKVMRDTPNLAPTLPARIFCMARGGDWSAAALTLNTHRVLGDITPQQEALLSRFLDPELYEDEPSLPIPPQITPLVFRMHEAIGEAIPTTSLPHAFAHSDLRSTTGWKAQLEAAERLARVGAVSENVLFGAYMARTPAASGGIWNRAKAIQKLDTAIKDNDADAIANHLPAAWAAMRRAKLELPFATYFAPLIAGRNDIGPLATTIRLLSPDYEIAAYLVECDAQGLAASTRARRLSAIKQLYRFAFEESWRSDNPAIRIKGPGRSKALPKTLSVAEVENLLIAARDSRDGLRNACLMELLYATGMRVTELVSLPVAAARGNPAMLLVRGKGGKERMVPLSPSAKLAMAAWLDHRDAQEETARINGAPPSKFLFPSRGKLGHLTRHRFFGLIKEFAMQAGVSPDKVTPHTLRHAFATHLLAGGADFKGSPWTPQFLTPHSGSPQVRLWSFW